MMIRIKATLVMVLVVFAIVAADYSFNAIYAYETLLDTIKRGQVVDCELAEKLIGAEVDKLISDVESCSKALKAVTSAAELQKAVKVQLGGFTMFTGLTAFDGNGVLAFAGQSAPASLVRGRYLGKALGGESVMTTTMKDQATGELVFYVCVPMGAHRALVATLPSEGFARFFSDYNSWKTGVISVIDGEGTFIVHYDPKHVRERLNYIEMAKANPGDKDLRLASDFTKKGLKDGMISGTYTFHGEKRVATFKRVSSDHIDWAVCSGGFVKESHVGDIWVTLLLSSLGVFLVGAVGAYLVSGMVVRPYRKLEGFHKTILEQSNWIKGELNRVSMILEAMPLSCQIWDRNIKCIECNDESVRLFRAKDKTEFLESVLTVLSPDVQQDGRNSSEAGRQHILKAFETGKQHFEWLHRTLDGEPMPVEVDLVRIPYGDDFAVVGFVHDMREHQRMIDEIESALEEAKRASKAKTSFLANMSHEMRTPLNAILGLSELTLEADLDDAVHENIEKIYAAGSMLLSTVNDILDISKIEAGKFEIINGDYDVPSTINDTVTQNILRIGEKPIKFILDIESDLPVRLNGDELRVKQVLNNLLSNAMKYTLEGTVELSVRCKREGDSVWVTVRVADTGIGIKPDDLKRLFSDYSQFDKNVRHRVEGTGLGLPITKMVLELMDGSIDVQSEYGKGSVFTARFRQNFVSDETIGVQTVENLRQFHYADGKRASNKRVVRADLPYARVLVVDDIATNLEVAKGLMKPYGMKVDCVTSGQQAVSAIRKATVKYDAVFMDHMMPEMDGITATRLIRTDIGTEYAKNIPIIALTANAIAGNEKMFLENGFQDFISKPMDLLRLDAVIKRWVRSPDHDRLLAEYQAVQPSEEAAQEQEPSNDQPQITEEIDGIDISKGIERFGSEEVYLKILRSYVETTQSLLGQLHLVDKGTMEDYAIRVHGIKGSSMGIGAFKVGEIAEALERAAKIGDFEFVSNNNKALINAAGLLILNIQEALDAAALRSGKPKLPGPDNELLAKLMDACGNYDTDAVDDIMSKIDAFDYDDDDGLVEWLRKNVAITAFAQIKDRLSVLLG